MNMLMKSMREATPQDGMFDSEQTRMYTSMLDQQLTQRMASRGIGLAEVMVRQLSSALNVPLAGRGVPGARCAGFPLNAPQGDLDALGQADPLRAKVPQGGMESYVPQGDFDPLRAKARVESYVPGR